MASASSLVTAGSDDSGVGTLAWSNPGNITAADNAWATVAIAATQVTHYLKGLMSTPFAVPADATINGIELTVNRNRQAGLGNVRDSTVKLVVGGTVSGNNKADTGTNWPSVNDGSVTYGSSSDLWGLSLSPSDVNATDFGAVVSATIAAGSSDTARVDDMTIAVYYTPVSTVAGNTKSNPVGMGLGMRRRMT